LDLNYKKLIINFPTERRNIRFLRNTTSTRNRKEYLLQANRKGGKQEKQREEARPWGTCSQKKKRGDINQG